MLSINFQKLYKRIFSLFFISIMFFAFSGSAFARDYSFPSLQIKATIMEDGSLMIREERTVDFSGEYSGLYQWIYKQPGEEIVNIQVYEGQERYDFNPSGEIGPSGTYFVKNEEDKTYVDWSFTAKDETKSFVLSYQIKNAVKLHNDLAEVYYIFVGDEWDKGVGNLYAEMIFPENIFVDEIRAWGHGPLHGNVEIVDNQKVVWEINDLDSNTLVAGRVTFPLSLVPEGTNFTGRDAWQEILEEENKLAEEANLQRSFFKISLWGGLVAVILGFLVSYIFWIKYGKEPKGDFSGEYYRELPSSRTPAEIGYLWRFKRVDAADITATILDLARKGYIRIEEYISEKKGIFSVKEVVDYRLIYLDKDLDVTEKISYHEIYLMDFLFKNVGDRNEVTFEELKRYSKKRKIEFKDFWDTWNKMIEQQAKAEAFFEEYSVADSFKKAIPALVVIALAILLLIIFKEMFVVLAIGMIVASFIYLISLGTHQRRTEKGANENNKWKAFRKFIIDFSNIKTETIPSLVVWEHYLVYAVCLGVAKEVIKDLELAYPDLQEGDYHFAQKWFIYHSATGGISDINQSFESLTSNITKSIATSIQTATGQTSSGSGTGGGFSGGGGMGASGGGGGGAR